MRKQQYRVSESKISIHAPAEGVTSPKKDNDAGRNISIHAPAVGATSADGMIRQYKNDFNPRSRGGSDLQPQRRPS